MTRERKVKKYSNLYQFKCVNILTIACIRLFEYNFIFLDPTILQKDFKEKNQYPMSHDR